MTAVTAFGSLVCSYTKGELLIHATNRCLLRPDAHQRGFLGLINFGSGLAIGLFLSATCNGDIGLDRKGELNGYLRHGHSRRKDH